ncbi:MAG TPA: SDR family oxidoreductase [Tepidisphaeraceae bacterium]|nr:SDR family oxidoreductase [Tepidisphaeraceae bacterium]
MVPERHPVVMVTGASAGVGRAVVRLFAQRHQARLGLLARGVERLESARREVEEAGGEAVVTPADVADADAVERAAATLEDRFGPIDVWVNNAMVSMMAPFRRMTLAEFRRITEVTFLGYVHGTHAALHRMLSRDQGVILQVGSALAYRSIPLQSAYCAAKHAVAGFTESLRTELLHDNSNVQLRIVHLPAVNTPQFEWIRNRMGGKSKPVGTIYQPEVAADAIVWTAYHNRPEFQLGYPTVQAILGDKVAPRWLDHYLANTVYEGHVTKIPDPPGRPDNLFDPAPGDFAAHGPYNAEAWRSSPQMWLNKHRNVLALAGLGLAAAAFFKRRPTRDDQRAANVRGAYTIWR